MWLEASFNGRIIRRVMGEGYVEKQKQPPSEKNEKESDSLEAFLWLWVKELHSTIQLTRKRIDSLKKKVGNKPPVFFKKSKHVEFEDEQR